jgi:hypothetical protein
VNSVYVFTKNTCLILTDPIDLEKWKLSPNALVNPDTSEIYASTDARFWKPNKEKNKITLMNPEEQLERRNTVLQDPVDKIPVRIDQYPVPVLIPSPVMVTRERNHVVIQERLSIKWAVSFYFLGLLAGFAFGYLL